MRKVTKIKCGYTVSVPRCISYWCMPCDKLMEQFRGDRKNKSFHPIHNHLKKHLKDRITVITEDNKKSEEKGRYVAHSKFKKTTGRWKIYQYDCKVCSI